MALVASLEVSLQLPDSVEVGERFYADVLCSGSGSELASVDVRASDGLAYLGRTRSSSYTSSYIGSRRTFQSSSTVRFLFEAVSGGLQTVGPLEVVLGDSVYVLSADTVLVTGPDSISIRDETSTSSSEEAIWISTSPQEGPYYPGKAFSVKYYLHTRVPLENIQQQWNCPTNGAASLVEGAEILQWRSVPGGISRAWILQLDVVPALPGPMRLPRVEVMARRFTASLFARGGRYHVISEPVVVEVSSFPSESRPANFTGIADSLSLNLSVPVDCLGQRNELHARLTASGPGASRMEDAPKVTVSGPSEITGWTRVESADTVRWDYVLRPLGTGFVRLGPDSVSWFDVREGCYRQAVAGPCTLTVDSVGFSPRAAGRLEPTGPKGRPVEILATALLGAVLFFALAAGGIGWLRRRTIPHRALEKAADEEELLSAVENQLSFLLLGRPGFMAVEDLQDVMDEKRVDPLLSRRIARFCKTIQRMLADGSLRERSLDDLKAEAHGLLNELREWLRA
jgi:hypothetical protein